MSGPKCPKCGFNSVRISRKSSYLQAKLLPSLGYYPWECIGCRVVFMAKDRGRHKRRSSATPAALTGANQPPEPAA